MTNQTFTTAELEGRQTAAWNGPLAGAFELLQDTFAALRQRDAEIAELKHNLKMTFNDDLKMATLKEQEAEISRLTEVTALAQDSLDARDAEARAYMAVSNALENYSGSKSQYVEAYESAMAAASVADGKLRIILAALDGPALMKKAIARDAARLATMKEK